MVQSVCNIWPALHFYFTYHSWPFGLVERTNGTIKIQPVKISEAFNLPWAKAFSIVLLNLRATPLRKHNLSPYEIVTGYPMHLDEGAYEPALLTGDNLLYCQGLLTSLKGLIN